MWVFFQSVISRVRRSELAQGYMSPLVSMSELRIDYWVLTHSILNKAPIFAALYNNNLSCVLAFHFYGDLHSSGDRNKQCQCPFCCCYCCCCVPRLSPPFPPVNRGSCQKPQATTFINKPTQYLAQPPSSTGNKKDKYNLSVVVRGIIRLLRSTLSH